MIEIINIMACLVLLAFLWRVAVAVHKWKYKLPVIAMSLVFGLQIIDPLARWLPAVLWTTVAVNVAVAIVTVYWRKELWALVRYKFELDDCTVAEAKMRRSSDYMSLDESNTVHNH